MMTNLLYFGHERVIAILIRLEKRETEAGLDLSLVPAGTDERKASACFLLKIGLPNIY